MKRESTFLRKIRHVIWIDSLPPGVLWDIGANVGLYSVYAGATREDLTVLAFEPAPMNYFILTRNIHLNHFEERVQPYLLAFSEKTELGLFNMDSLAPGGSLFEFGERKTELLQANYKSNVAYRQAMIGFSIDDYIKTFSPLFPTAMKIDVDGIEDKIIAGARKTLNDGRFRSLSIELDESQSEYCERVFNMLADAGLERISKKHSEMLEGGPFASVFNFVFQKRG